VRPLALAIALGLCTACTRSPSETTSEHSATAATSASSPAHAQTAAGEPEPPPVPCPELGGLVDAAKLKRHLDNFMQIAKQHDGNRSREAGGYQASVAYVMHQLDEAGLSPKRSAFDVRSFEILGPGALVMTKPEKRAFLPGRNRLRTGDFTPVRGSPPGSVTAEVAAVEVDLGLGNRSESGCEAHHFDDGAGGSLVDGKIALLQRGRCPFVDKVRNAQTAGARAVVVFNQGDTAKRRGLLAGSLEGRGPDPGIVIPVVLTTTPVGEQLVAATGRGPVELHVATDTSSELVRLHNVIVDVPGKRDSEVLVVGGHLDGVPRGPGINDNASGSAALIELARPLAGCRPVRTLRFAWWGAEEEGLLGSTAWVNSLGEQQHATLLGYVNLDMIASPNHAFMLTDGDGSKTGSPAPSTAGELEAFLRRDFDGHDLPLLEVDYAGRSDDKPFYDAGIGTVMLGAGYDEEKTPAQAALFGGKVSQPFDPCYHRACDDLDNVDLDVLTVITAAVARAIQHFGVRGEGLDSALR
jgi:Zn-dependent M28 family amino/carboxypeptidase